MNIFQVVGIGIAGVGVCSSYIMYVQKKTSLRACFAWVCLWGCAGSAIIWPRSTFIVARFLGIGRGADLVIYCTALAMVIGFYCVYVTIQRIEKNITIIVRHLALHQDKPNRRCDADTAK